MQLTMLGVGSSGGTPMIGCECTTCTSTHSRNQRTRCSSLITLDTGQHILIDTGPDLRQQALREKITHIEAVLYTHTHADHLHGIDDLRGFANVNEHKFRFTVALQHVNILLKSLDMPCVSLVIFGIYPCLKPMW